MAALDYLQHHDLQARPLSDGRLSVWPVENITPEIRVWIRSYKAALLHWTMPSR